MCTGPVTTKIPYTNKKPVPISVYQWYRERQRDTHPCHSAHIVTKVTLRWQSWSLWSFELRRLLLALVWEYRSRSHQLGHGEYRHSCSCRQQEHSPVSACIPKKKNVASRQCHCQAMDNKQVWMPIKNNRRFFCLYFVCSFWMLFWSMGKWPGMSYHGPGRFFS